MHYKRFRLQGCTKLILVCDIECKYNFCLEESKGHLSVYTKIIECKHKGNVGI